MDTSTSVKENSGEKHEADETNNKSEDESEGSTTSQGSDWHYMPDTVLLNIFQYLTPRELTIAGEVCKSWYRVSHDEFLWKDLFYQTYKIDPDIGIKPGKTSWLGEFKRLTYHIPLIETELLTEHCHQVLHVSFSHNGKMFATCSKDGYVFVWESKYPCSIKYLHDMKTFNWKYTQFSQFNSSDTLLLVCGALFGSFLGISGEIAVFKLSPNFELQCRIVNKPNDTFGAWYSEHYLLSGNLYWLAHLVNTSLLWLNKASQESSSEHVPIMTQLFRFYNRNASSVRAIMVANCLTPEQNEHEEQPSTSNANGENGTSTSDDVSSPCSDNSLVLVHYASSSFLYTTLEGGFMKWKKLGDGFEYATPIQYNQEYREVEKEKSSKQEDDEDSDENSECNQSEPKEPPKVVESDDELSNAGEKYLIFTTGSKTYAPHQVGFKRIKNVKFPKRVDPGPSLRDRFKQKREERDQEREEVNWLDYDSVADQFDKVDHLIDLHGHIIGMALSPDHRYLYVNTRPWPQGCVITNPLQPPPIAQEIDIHVIDLVTLKQVGTMLRAHKAYTPNNECFYIFLDVCDDYVASGAEDKHGYIWDRHYGICLAKFPHAGVVNSVAFNPRDPEFLITTSDDHTVKVWRSRASIRSLNFEEDSFPRGS
ncbi:F-box/WD repeat-containing protein 5 isoform X2 [Ceratina calcarata]|uniref:F-box/WD repeat-containing protein 5 isoform X2 n=1 Tax=Ceratina calcarata TaxID=156304 RepID=A0AAJ7S7K9_9HYME|nr:F-box/WD repeat-containing protein 5 isoform X2 [Ceratina calcarata]